MRSKAFSKFEQLFSRKVFTSVLVLIGLLLCGNLITDAQDKHSQQNYHPGIPYSISDIENINLTNGNLMFNFDFGNVRGHGSAMSGLALKYNSKLYESHVMTTLDSSGQEAAQLFLRDGEEGGWKYDENYRLQVISRNDGLDEPVQVGGGCQLPSHKGVYVWKLIMYFPDGSQHEFRPTGYSDSIYQPNGDLVYLGDGYFNVNPSGQITNLYWESLGASTACNGEPSYSTSIVTSQDPNPKMTYYSTDGTYMRLEIPTGQNPRFPFKWTIYMPDGSKVVSETDANNNPLPQKIYDKNGNYVEQGAVTLPDGTTAGGWVDQFGRYVARKSNLAALEDYIYKQGYNGELLKWTVKWKDISVIRQYTTSGASDGQTRGGSSSQLLCATLRVVDKILLPEQLGGLEYSFNYNAHSPAVGCSVSNPTYSAGWGELTSVTLPSGARAEYGYTALLPEMDTNMLLPRLGKVSEKKLIYDTNYDSIISPVTEKWTYSISSGGSTVTAPDGGVSRQSHYSTDTDNDLSGRVYKEIKPDGTIAERIWKNNKVGGCPQNGCGSMRRLNTYIKTEFLTVPDNAGNPVLTAIKDFDYDKNGNITKITEYDWVAYASIPHNSNGRVTGLPAGITPVRITENIYHNQTEDAADTTTNNLNSYWNTTAPLIRNAAASTKVTKANGEVAAYSEFSYDNPSTTANLTETRSWDSYKNGTSQPFDDPLTASNSISTTAVYDQYGNPTSTTDAKGYQTQITYGAVGGFTGLYPTKTETAYGTPIQQTVQAEYDFHTGLAKKVTTLGNTTSENVVSETVYDALGRPTIGKAAVGTSLEVWTQTEYNDAARRVIVKSDLEVKGDGKRVAVQHFDQLGRVRLSRTLENIATEDPTNEAHGIKVQTRYRYDNGANPTSSNGEYSLTSNPYRAATAAQATNEPTMGWKVAYEDKTGNLSTTETFGGVALPAPWGSNTNSTGLVKEEEDTNTTTVTDEAGKKRRTVNDALGRLIRVDEPDANNNLGSIASPIQATYYIYDLLDNLTTVQQSGNNTEQCGGTVTTCSQTRSFTYSSLERLLTATNPESGAFQYTYDNNGNLLTKKDARNITTTYTYDALNRVTFRDYSNSTPDITYTYDDPLIQKSKGELTKVSSAVSETHYTAFDEQGRILGSRQITDGNSYNFGYTYYLNGALKTQTYPSLKVVKYDYSADGDLAQVSNNQTQRYYANSFSYTAHGQIEKLRLGNGKWEATKFNSALQMTEIGLGHSTTDTGLWKTNYEYGELQTNGTVDALKNNGNLAKQTITVPTIAATTGFTAVQSYNYDKLDRLKSATETVGTVEKWKQTFDYDRFGNKRLNIGATTLQSSESSAIPKVANPEVLPSYNQYKADQDNDGINDYLYDPSGNITKNAQERNFTYDGENRQITAIGNNLSVSYAYDGNDKRVKSHNAVTNQTTIFVYDGDGSLAAEYTINIPPPTSPTISYLTEDALGSVRVVTDSAGDIKARRDFLPFGEELFAGIGSRTTNQKYSANGDDVRKKFATYQRDVETGLDYAQSRYYSPMQGRFTSPDEFKGGPDELFDFEEDASNNPTFYADLENPQSLNKYQYGYNNSYKYNDPSGHCPPIIVAGVLIAIACLTNPDYAVAPTGRETREEMRDYRTTYGSRALLDLIPGPTRGASVISGLVSKVLNRGGRTVVTQTSGQVVKQAVKQPVKQATKQTTKSTKKGANKTSSKNTGNKNRGGRGRFKTGQDDLEQLKGVKKAQQDLRKGKGKGKTIIDSTKKSEQRVDNRNKKIRNLKDAIDEYDNK